MIIDQLRGLGANPSLPSEVLHYLYVPSESAAATASGELRKSGFATTEQVVSVGSARLARETLTAIAATHGGAYDGWEAAGTP